MKTYNDIYLNTRRRLRAAGISAHDLEARLIVSYASGKTREELLSASRFFVVDKAVVFAVEEMISRRLEGEPVAYIVGEWEFYGLPMAVNGAVLIPRVDTELLAEAAIGIMRRRHETARLLDLCAGSGCLGIAIAHNVPDCRVVLAEYSKQALAVCRENIRLNRVSRNAAAIEADALDAPPALLGSFDAIVCNPPYIPAGELEGLDVSVRGYEPVAALNGGEDGLSFFRAIASNWRTLLKPGGHLAFECGSGQAADVREIMEGCGFRNIGIHLDTSGIERVLTGTKR